MIEKRTRWISAADEPPTDGEFFVLALAAHYRYSRSYSDRALTAEIRYFERQVAAEPGARERDRRRYAGQPARLERWERLRATLERLDRAVLLVLRRRQRGWGRGVS